MLQINKHSKRIFFITMMCIDTGIYIRRNIMSLCLVFNVKNYYIVKVRLQSRELASRYKGTWNCFVTTVKQEKVQ